MIGKYKIISKLGQGGFGAVYKVEYKNQFYALKMYDPSKPGSLEDLNREYEIGIKVTSPEKNCHPFIACIYEKGVTQNNEYYLVMEYIEGNDLQKIIDINKNWTFITEFDIIKLMKYIIKGIDYLHSKDIIHMDIKPLNIMFNKNHMKLKIIDLGVACLNYFDPIDSELRCFNYVTNKGYVVGTLDYLSPEMFIIGEYINNNKNNTTINQDMYIKNDIWALGITFAELCNYKFGHILPKNLGRYIAENIVKNIDNPNPPFDSKVYKNPLIKNIIEGCLKSDYRKRLNTKQLLNMIKSYFTEDIDMENIPKDIQKDIPKDIPKGMPKNERQGNYKKFMEDLKFNKKFMEDLKFNKKYGNKSSKQIFDEECKPEYPFKKKYLKLFKMYHTDKGGPLYFSQYISETKQYAEIEETKKLPYYIGYTFIEKIYKEIFCNPNSILYKIEPSKLNNKKEKNFVEKIYNENFNDIKQNLEIFPNK